MGMAYLAAWKGPVYEKDDPYGDNQTKQSNRLSMCRKCRSLKAKIMRRSRRLYSSTAAYRHPFIMHCAVHSLPPIFYNKSTDAYCYIGTEKPNHDVVIVRMG